MAIFPGEPGSASSPLDPPQSVPEENLRGLVEQRFLQAKHPSCHPTISVKAVKEHKAIT